ncbi:MAG: hypothetical protein J7647_29825 [Cyanobacteria bacterium SBLK]|nr:hypothetical protein [Cyanobacteria bacterium SBLK]
MMESNRQKLAELDRAIIRNPEDARAIARRGECYRLMARYEEALGDFNRAIALKPEYDWAIAHRGECYRLMARYEEALENFGDAIQLNNKSAWNFAHRGASYYPLKQYEKALADIDRALQLHPDYPWALFYRVNLDIRKNCYEEALADFDRAIVFDKTLIPSWQGERGLILSYLGRYDRAIECCEAGLLEKPEDYIILYTLAVVKARWQGLTTAQGEIEKTRQALQAATQPSQRPGVIYRWGGLAALEGREVEALNYLREAISLDSEPLELARRDLAWLELRDLRQFRTLIEGENEDE